MPADVRPRLQALRNRIAEPVATAGLDAMSKIETAALREEAQRRVSAYSTATATTPEGKPNVH